MGCDDMIEPADIDSPLNACMYREHCKGLQARLKATEAALVVALRTISGRDEASARELAEWQIQLMLRQGELQTKP